ncbi:hypothetical protein A0R60_2150 [Enterobacter asburiae]|nr:hypothetical protein A0R60_2150 [Enterobacter asburiae]
MVVISGVAWCIPSPFVVGVPFWRKPKNRVIVYDNFYPYVYELLLKFE